MQVHGEVGQPVVLLPGGAAPCAGFFPGLVEGLVADPGCRVVVHDRPGTGRSTEPGGLAGATAHLHALVTELGLGPVVVVGQSLGGAVATLWARDHPGDVAGLVLLDPTPINDPAACVRIERPVRVVGAVARLPVVGPLLDRAFSGLARRRALRTPMPPEGVAALDTTLEGDIPQLAAATRGLAALAARLHETDLPLLPSAVVTADGRRPTDPVARAHERLATAFGATLTSWPGATHAVHLDHPREVLALVRDVVSRVDRA